jgi:hypothetical protein
MLGASAFSVTDTPRPPAGPRTRSTVTLGTFAFGAKEFAMSKKSGQVPEDKLKLNQMVIDTQPEIELKGGMKLPHTSTNGYMFSSLTKDGRVGIRLSKEDAQAFIKKYEAIPFKNYGANIKEHVEVPDALLEKPKERGKWLQKSYRYSKSLKPKK